MTALRILTIHFSVYTILAAAPEKINLPMLASESFASPVKSELIDSAAYAEWTGGRETAFDTTAGEDKHPEFILWTEKSHPKYAFVRFGDTNEPGVRHLRIGFKEEIPVGSVLTMDGGTLSVLKHDAPYPGDMGNDDHWQTARRMVDGQPTTTETESGEIALWILPPGTSTRALRFTHDANITDERYAGELTGVMVSSERLGDQSWNANAAASTNSQEARKILNRNHDQWHAWENHPKGKSPQNAPVVSEEHPEWITLAWKRPVKLDGLIAVWAGIATAEIQTYTGSPDQNPADATDSDWKTVSTYGNIRHKYAARFWPNKLDIEKQIITRALRLKITEAGAGLSHANNNGGKRVWLGELIAFRKLGDEALKAAEIAKESKLPHPPIPIRFTLEKPGYVTLVIEKPDGFRIRNLISETWFPAGENTAWWDGSDDLGRDADAAEHGVYNIPARPAEPGDYRVRGLVRGEIDPHYEFSVYATGNPPWSTKSGTGAWLANHSPPQAAAFIPAAQSPTGEDVVYLGCYVTEGPDGLAWVDLDGNKLGGKKWIGGHWTAAPFLARDAGTSADPDTHVYVGSVWETAKRSGIGELRITALTKKGDKDIIKHNLGDIGKAEKAEDTAGKQLGGLAVQNGIAVATLTKKSLMLFIDTKTGKVIAETAVDAPKGIAIEPSDGSLLVLSGTQLLRYPPLLDFENLPQPEALVSSGLEAPAGITLDEEGHIYISDWGDSHQVKIFTATGEFIRAIGKPGPPAEGKYDPLHMNHPHGIAVDSEGKIWVTEHNYIPKRVSVWSEQGELLKTFYGPGKYGGGGTLDPLDKTKFYYADEGKGSMEFKLDWDKGTWELENVLTCQMPGDMELGVRAAAPEQAIYHKDRRYFANSYNTNPVAGHPTAFLFTENNGITEPCAGMGSAPKWELLKTEAFRPRWPVGVDLATQANADVFFIWSDTNGDAQAQPDEVTFHSEKGSGVTVMQDLSFCVARVGDKAMEFPPTGFTESGVPLYDFSKGKILASNVQNPKSSGGDQALSGEDGWSVVTLGIGPFDSRSICGAKDGVAKWSYPSPWPGLHASHMAPRPDRPGQLIGTTRLPGGFFEIEGTDVGPLWAVHSNHGMMYVFTQDGLFVATLFKDNRGGTQWRMPTSVRNMPLHDITLSEENFWPTLSHTSDGNVYLVDGNRSAIVRLDGLGNIRRLPDSELTLTKEDLQRSQAWQVEAEAARQAALGTGTLVASVLDRKPAVDGDLSDWDERDFVDIDKSGVKAYFNATTKPYDITGSIAASGDRLYAAWKTGDSDLLQNSGDMPVAPFKTGGALDIMLGPDGDRDKPTKGDLRLLVTVVDGKPWALLYRPVVPGTRTEDKVPFSSPWRTITLDKVEDVTADLEFARKDGNYEISIPFNTLGFTPKKGAKIRGDIGILRGNGNDTTARVYWSNKATGITADVPAEAMLAPKLWGRIEFK